MLRIRVSVYDLGAGVCVCEHSQTTATVLMEILQKINKYFVHVEVHIKTFLELKKY